MVTVADVREYLDNLSDDRVADPVVQRQIILSEAKVTAEKSSLATQAAIDNAVLTVAGYAVYLAYTAEYERGVGVLPATMQANLQLYEAAANYFLELAKRGTVALQPVLKQIKTLWQEYRDGAYDINW